MASKSSSSSTFAVLRIVILGIAFDVSRFVAREILGALAGRPSDNDDSGCKRSSSKIDNESGSESTNIIKQCKCYVGKLRRQLSKTLHNKRRLGLCLYLLLPPPLVLCGVWSTIQCKRNSDTKEPIAQNFGGMYVSSLVSSLGFVFWFCPGLFQNSSMNEDEKPKRFQKDEKDASANLPTVPSAIFRPPMMPTSSISELERRPRSDSIRSVVTEGSATSTQVVENDNQKKYLEILVHNVSHTDLVLGLSGEKGLAQLAQRSVESSFPAEFEDTPRKKNVSPTNITQCDDEKYIMCKPRFSAFDLFTRRVLSELKGQIDSTSTGELKVISYPRYERSSKTARYTLVTPRPRDHYMLPVGFNLERDEGLNNTAVDLSEMPNLRVRGRDIHKVEAVVGETARRLNLPLQQNDAQIDTGEALRINAVFFPLLATLMPRWLGQISDKFSGRDVTKKVAAVAAPVDSPNVKKVVVLVSGVGTPRNWTHSILGNSTQTCAELMELFIHVLYPDITVVRIHSETNIFRYDENITFATQELMPCIDSYRDAHARSLPYPDEEADGTSRPFNPDWRQSVAVTYSFADGSAARSHAIQAALRSYRPTYFHFWQLKTFWHESKITDEDIEVHSFEEMETEPAMAVDQTSSTVMMVVNEMKVFRKDFLDTLKDGGRSDLKSFWLRKTRKPVLAVLLVQNPDGSHVLYRGTNMEVSMPTGSLCAERNVIGTALASNPGLKREDLLMVAVLSVALPDEPKQYIPPPGPPLCRPVSSTEESEEFVREVEDKLKQHQALGAMRRSTSRSSFASIDEIGTKSKSNENDGWEIDVFNSSSRQEIDSGMSPLASPLLQAKVTSPPKSKEAATMIPDLLLGSLPETSTSGVLSGSSTPKRRISLYQKKSHSKIGGGVKKKRQSLLVESSEVR